MNRLKEEVGKRWLDNNTLRKDYWGDKTYVSKSEERDVGWNKLQNWISSFYREASKSEYGDTVFEVIFNLVNKLNETAPLKPEDICKVFRLLKPIIIQKNVSRLEDLYYNSYEDIETFCDLVNDDTLIDSIEMILSFK